ncbi:CTP synthetase [Burkholderia thailandensis]|nr:CTP synthetase [Burkholderia thailandensis]AWY60409.1 CTP synthetase [Burkholderia thailandensis]AWY66603.1 CTP synthetase [Burkholderia thailandensis]NOK42665.1 CTP synthetase [Burkholderia thailandensis]NOK53072.1 CTP synthetase [Burkholderia thailandensis]
MRRGRDRRGAPGLHGHAARSAAARCVKWPVGADERGQ